MRFKLERSSGGPIRHGIKELKQAMTDRMSYFTEEKDRIYWNLRIRLQDEEGDVHEEIKSLEDILALSKEFACRLIIDTESNIIEIYDGYRE